MLLSDCVIPDRSIGAGETLRDIQWADLSDDWEEGIDFILKAICHSGQRHLEPVEMKFVRVDRKSVNMKEYGDLKISIEDKPVGVLSGFSVLNAKIQATSSVDIKAECFLEDKESQIRSSPQWVGTLIHEATLKNLKVMSPLTILVGYSMGVDSWFDKLLGGYNVLSIRTDADSNIQSEFIVRKLRGKRVDAFSSDD